MQYISTKYDFTCILLVLISLIFMIHQLKLFCNLHFDFFFDPCVMGKFVA